MWVLFYIVLSSDHSAIGNVEFLTRESCDQTAQVIRELPKYFKGHSPIAICVKK